MKRFTGLVMLIALLFGCNESILFEDAVTEPALKSVAVKVVVPDDFTTVQMAVDNAPDGATILIKEGVYAELVNIHYRNDLTIIGQNAVLCPPEGIVYGEGYFNLDILESSNITVKNLKFDGKLNNETTYPIDRAIAVTNSSGNLTNNKFKGYGLAIACYNIDLEDMIDAAPENDLKKIYIFSNKFSDCYGQIGVMGNYEMEISHNIINYVLNQDRLCDHWFPFWRGIEIEGGTGSISKNLIKFKNGSEFLVESEGIRLMKTNPVCGNDIYSLRDMVVSNNTINGTDVGINVNDSFYPDWTVEGLQLLNNRFVNVSEMYRISNGDVPVEVLP